MLLVMGARIALQICMVLGKRIFYIRVYGSLKVSVVFVSDGYGQVV